MLTGWGEPDIISGKPETQPVVSLQNVFLGQGFATKRVFGLLAGPRSGPPEILKNRLQKSGPQLCWCKDVVRGACRKLSGQLVASRVLDDKVSCFWVPFLGPLLGASFGPPYSSFNKGGQNWPPKEAPVLGPKIDRSMHFFGGCGWSGLRPHASEQYEPRNTGTAHCRGPDVRSRNFELFGVPVLGPANLHVATLRICVLGAV